MLPQASRMFQWLVRCGVLCPQLEDSPGHGCGAGCVPPAGGGAQRLVSPFFPSAASSSCLLSSWQHRQSPSRRGPGEVLEHLWLRVAAALQLGLAVGLWDQPGAQSGAGGPAGTLGLTAAQVLVLLWCTRDTRWRRDEVQVPSCAPRTSRDLFLTPRAGWAGHTLSWSSFRSLFLLLILFIVSALSLGSEGILLNGLLLHWRLQYNQYMLFIFSLD